MKNECDVGADRCELKNRRRRGGRLHRNNYLDGGGDNDILIGGAGRDTYIYNAGDGVDQIWGDSIGADASVLIFGAGVSKDAMKLRQGSLLLDLGNGDAIHIDNFDADNPLATQSFASFQFADGSSLTWDELLARGFDLDGTEGADSLIGTGADDRIAGKGGDGWLRISQESRRWRDGDRSSRAANDSAWRRQA